MATEPKKKTAVCKKVHFNADGPQGRSAVPNETELQFQFAHGDKPILTIKRELFTDEMWTCAAWHGLAQKIGDSYSGESGDAAHDEADKMLEQIVAGNWVTESKSTGPRIGLLVEAVIAAKVAEGMEYDEAAIKTKLADKAYAKSVKANDQVNDHYKRLEAERATARAKEASKAAKGSDTGGLADI